MVRSRGGGSMWWVGGGPGVVGSRDGRGLGVVGI